MTEPIHFSEATGRVRKAQMATASDPTVSNPVADRIRREILDEISEKLAVLSPTALRAAVENTPIAPDQNSPFWRLPST